MAKTKAKSTREKIEETRAWGGGRLAAIAVVEIAALDTKGNHRERADLIKVTRSWLDEPAGIPANARKLCEDVAEVVHGDVKELWVLLGLAAESA